MNLLKRLFRLISMALVVLVLLLALPAVVTHYYPIRIFPQPDRYEFRIEGRALAWWPETHVSPLLSKSWGCGGEYSLIANTHLSGEAALVEVGGVYCSYPLLLGFGNPKPLWFDEIGMVKTLQIKLGDSIDSYTIQRDGEDVLIEPASGGFTRPIPYVPSS